MPLLDSQGRLLGKISILDVGAALVILLVVVGIFLVPGRSGSVAQVSGTQPIEVDVLVQGLNVRDPQQMQETFEQAETTKLIVRNQPYGQVQLKSAERLPNAVPVTQPDGSLEMRPNPAPQSQHEGSWILTLGGDARMTDSGPVLGNNKIKIGTPIKLEGERYRFGASTIDVRVQE
jgi:hypothetical protein